MEPIVIFGAGGFAREVLVLIEDINRERPQWDVLGFLDDAATEPGELNGLPVLGNRDWLSRTSKRPYLALGIGTPAIKRAIVDGVRDLVAGFPTLVHPSVQSSRTVRLAEGVVVTAGNILTTDIDVGSFAMINLACTVGHDCAVGSYATISPGANISGHVTIGEGCDIGTASAVIQGVSIGEWSIIGAGAVVTGNLPANCTAVGVPARVVKERPAGWHRGGAQK